MFRTGNLPLSSLKDEIMYWYRVYIDGRKEIALYEETITMFLNMEGVLGRV